MKPKYKRILLKLSGEALAGEQGFGLNQEVIARVVDEIVKVHEMGVEIGLVIGGGNFWRGRQGTRMERTTADQMGMLSTVMNSLAMMDAIEQRGIPVRVQTALNMVSIAEPFILRKALRHFEQGRIVIFACGTGNPYCSTDTAAALRACEISADVLLMAKNVDGIYDSDPKTNPNAKKYDKLTYTDIVNQGLKVIDFTAATMCMENGVPTLAFGLNEKDSILRAVCGEKIGTLISADRSVTALEEEYSAIRAGRANPHVLDRIDVEAYGGMSKLIELGNVSALDARCLQISLWDKSLLKAVEKAILQSNLGLTPTNDGKVIRIVFPVMTEERRKELVKQIKKMGEETKVEIRNARRNAMDTLKKMKTAKELSEDDHASCEADVEKSVSAAMTKLDAIIAAKEKDLMSI